MYRIEWEDGVLRRFTDQFDQLNEQDQSRVMDALDEAARLLSAKPLEVGESRATPFERILIHPPISLAIRVDLRLQTVMVVGAQIL